MMKNEVISAKKMESIFCDNDNIPGHLLKNYYLLVTKIFGTYDIQKNTVIFEELKNCVLNLPEREKNYVILRFGLDNGKFRTLQFISMKYNISKERVRQSLEKILRDLSYDKSNFLVEYKIEFLIMKEKRIKQEIERYKKFIEVPKKLNLTVHDFDFSARARNCLLREGIVTYEQLMDLTYEEMMQFPKMGKTSAQEVWYKLHEDIS